MRYTDGRSLIRHLEYWENCAMIIGFHNLCIYTYVYTNIYTHIYMACAYQAVIAAWVGIAVHSQAHICTASLPKRTCHYIPKRVLNYKPLTFQVLRSSHSLMYPNSKPAFSSIDLLLHSSFHSHITPVIAEPTTWLLDLAAQTRAKQTLNEDWLMPIRNPRRTLLRISELHH